MFRLDILGTFCVEFIEIEQAPKHVHFWTPVKTEMITLRLKSTFLLDNVETFLKHSD